MRKILKSTFAATALLAAMFVAGALSGGMLVRSAESSSTTVRSDVFEAVLDSLALPPEQRTVLGDPGLPLGAVDGEPDADRGADEVVAVDGVSGDALADPVADAEVEVGVALELGHADEPLGFLDG